jgi:hypothetical protein
LILVNPPRGARGTVTENGDAHMTRKRGGDDADRQTVGRGVDLAAEAAQAGEIETCICRRPLAPNGSARAPAASPCAPRVRSSLPLSSALRVATRTVSLMFLLRAGRAPFDRDQYPPAAGV